VVRHTFKTEYQTDERRASMLGDNGPDTRGPMDRPDSTADRA